MNASTPGIPGRALESAVVPNSTIAAHRVLVVDDDHGIRLVIARALKRSGYEVFVADSGPDALAQLARRPEVVAIVSDVEMPVMTGFELARAVFADYPGLPILFVTASTLGDDLLGHPLIDLVRKPVKLVDLCARLQALIDLAAHSTAEAGVSPERPA